MIPLFLVILSSLSNNLLSMYTEISPVLNHPGCLKLERVGSGGRGIWKSVEEVTDDWLVDSLKRSELQRIHEEKNSPKFIVVAHILALAFSKGEKVLIYSKCLKTLALMETFLASSDWKKHVHSLAKAFPSMKLGRLKKNRDFVRIDGNVNSEKRGCLVGEFNEREEIKIFLISSLAGGIGINLVSIRLK